MVRCHLNCGGINNNPEKGIIPRGLVLEKREGKCSCIVIGLNPGKCNATEREFYLENGINFDSILSYFDGHLKNLRYFTKTRDLITFLGFGGDILWTELVKCECLGQNGIIPVQTLRVCIDNYLRKEIDSFNTPTIFPLGNNAFDFCSLRFPNHFIVGLPHPTGSYGHFDRLKKKVESNTKKYADVISRKEDDAGNIKAIKLSDV